jgi:uncharacterized protein (TIGR04255 family)
MTLEDESSILEAIFEIRWEFAESAQKEASQNYYIMIGRMYDELKEDYRFYEPLQSASVPNEIAEYLVQHRYRVGADEWPLVQMGPKIMAINSTQDYDWIDFEKRILKAYDALMKIYPKDHYHLTPNSFILRYVNAMSFDFSKRTNLKFLKKEMKTTVNFDSKLFESTDLDNKPLAFDCRFSFKSFNPQGQLNFRFYRGDVRKADAIIWETFVESKLDNISDTLDLKEWLGSAHSLCKKWYQIIRGLDGV